MSDIKIILDLVKDIREESKEVRSELKGINSALTSQALDIVKIQSNVGQIQSDISRNTDDLCLHMKRTKILEENQEQHRFRIEKLEEPGKLKKILWTKFTNKSKVVITILTIIALSTGIILNWSKLLALFS
jgi:hypothetical protein